MQCLKQFTELDPFRSSLKENEKNSISAEHRSFGWAGDAWGLVQQSVTATAESQARPQPAQSPGPCEEVTGARRAQPGAHGDSADPGLAAVAVGLQTLFGALPGSWEADNERYTRNQKLLLNILLFINLNEWESNFYKTDLGTDNFTTF